MIQPYQTVPNTPPDESKALRLIVTPAIFLSFAVVLFVLRIWVRARGSKLGLDDLFITAAVAGATGLYIVTMIAVSHGLGRHIDYLTPSEITMNLRLTLFIAEFYVWPVTLVKISLVFTLLRFKGNEKIWRRGLYILMGFIMFLALACSLVDYLHCQPTRAIWDMSYSRSHCMTYRQFGNWIKIASSMFFTTDIIFSIIPIFIVHKLHLKTREKVLTCLLMAFGLITSSAIIPKFISLQGYGSSPDITWLSSDLVLWSNMEISLGIIAACAPALKSAFERFLRRHGVLSAENVRSDWKSTDLKGRNREDRNIYGSSGRRSTVCQTLRDTQEYQQEVVKPQVHAKEVNDLPTLVLSDCGQTMTMPETPNEAKFLREWKEEV